MPEIRLTMQDSYQLFILTKRKYNLMNHKQKRKLNRTNNLMLDKKANLVMTHKVRSQIKSLLAAPHTEQLSNDLLKLQASCIVPSFSLVQVNHKPAIDKKGKLVYPGTGLYRCKQTGDLVLKSFVPASTIPLGF